MGIGFYGALNRVISGGIAGRNQVKSGFSRYKFNTPFLLFLPIQGLDGKSLKLEGIEYQQKTAPEGRL